MLGVTPYPHETASFTHTHTRTQTDTHRHTNAHTHIHTYTVHTENQETRKSNDHSRQPEKQLTETRKAAKHKEREREEKRARERNTKRDNQTGVAPHQNKSNTRTNKNNPGSRHLERHENVVEPVGHCRAVFPHGAADLPAHGVGHAEGGVGLRHALCPLKHLPGGVVDPWGQIVPEEVVVKKGHRRVPAACREVEGLREDSSLQSLPGYGGLGRLWEAPKTLRHIGSQRQI